MILEVAVTDQRAPEAAVEMRREALREVDGAMLSTGAAQRDRHVAAVRTRERRQPALQKSGHVVDKALDFVVTGEEIGDRLVAAAQRAERRFPVGILQ